MIKDNQAVSFALMGRTFRLYFKMMRESGWGRMILYISTSLLTGALYALNTPVMESLVTAVTNVAQGAGASVIILPAVLFFLCGAGGMALDNLGMYYQIVFEQRVRSGLMRRTPGGYALTGRGRDISNTVMADFIIDNDEER